MSKLFLTSSILATGLFALTTVSAFAQTTPKSTPIPEDAIETAPETLPTDEVDFVFSEAPGDHAIGSDTAPITMITYASVTCGHCGKWFQDEWPVVKRELIETGKMRFVLRPLPTPPAMLSVTGFLMAECAPEEDYFSSIEYQMENQEKIFEAAQNGTVQEEYSKVAAMVGLNGDEEINACLSKPENMARLQLSQKRADAAEVQGVPAFYVGGQAYKGKQDGTTLVSLISSMYESGQSNLPESALKEDAAHEHEKGHDHEHEG